MSLLRALKEPFMQIKSGIIGEQHAIAALTEVIMEYDEIAPSIFLEVNEMQAQIIQDFLELVRIPVQSRDERLIADNLKAKLKNLGLEVIEDPIYVEGGNTGNIRAVLKGDPAIEPIMFSAHMDRVKNNGAISPVWDAENNIMRADGFTILAADDIAGICVILDALRRVISSGKPHGDIEIALSVCEEAGVLGSRFFDFSSFKAKKAFVFDIPGRIGKIVLQAPSKAKLIYKIHGKSAHAGNEPEKGVNAIRAAAALILAIPDSRITPYTTTNVSTIHAGTNATNVVCDYAEVLAEARSTDNEEFEDILKKFAEPVAEIEAKYGVTIEYEPNVLYKTFKVEQDEDIAKIAASAIRKMNIEPVFARGGGGMDGNHFNNNGIRAIGIAPGYFKNHTPNEHLYLDDLQKCGELAAEIVWSI